MAQMIPDEEQARALNALTERVIGLAFKVGGVLGHGFLEKVYQNALAHELRKAGLKVQQQRRLTVLYDGAVVGDYVADLVIDDCLLIETKAARAMDDAHVAQCINYLAATGFPLCLLLNFSKRVQVRRIVGPSAPQFPHPHLGPSGPSVAFSHSGTPMTWAEYAELDDSEAPHPLPPSRPE